MINHKEKNWAEFGLDRRINEFLAMRNRRCQFFQNGNYILRQVMMRDEFEHFINGSRIFKNLSLEPRDQEFFKIPHRYDYLNESYPESWKKQTQFVIAQLLYLKELLMLQYQDTPRLEFRMTRSFFRIHFAIFEHLNSNLLGVSTNTGYVFVNDTHLNNKFLTEFGNIWEDGSMPQLQTNQEWDLFFSLIISFLENDIKRRKYPRRFDVKKILKEEIDFPDRTMDDRDEES